MSADVVTFRGGQVFDGERLMDNQAVRFRDGALETICAEKDMDVDGQVVELHGDILAHGYVDLQVNGGNGLMFNDDPSVATLSRMASAHRHLGTTLFLPTLITDTPDKTQAAISAVRSAVADGVAGIGGLHLEGPHLSVARKGAHDPAMIRPMMAEDLELLLNAARALPALMVTVAPENVSVDQVATLSKAGVIVSLGHTDASFDTCLSYADAGARCATHLFNAMSQIQNREPGLVGAALDSGRLSAGLIADGVHVHPTVMRAAWASKVGPGRIFLVTDAMAAAGTDIAEFSLGGRTIHRRGGQLTLADGTLAGADLDLTTALRVMVQSVGVSMEEALAAATRIPAELIGHPGRLNTTGAFALPNGIRIASDLSKVTVLAD